MITTDAVKSRLKEDVTLLVNILNHFGFHNINSTKKEIRCAYDTQSNPTSVRISLENLSANVWSKNISGDIYTLLMWKSESNFNAIHDVLVSFIGDLEDEITIPVKPLFGGFFNPCEIIDTKRYTESILNKYEKIPSLKLYNDNIFLKAQEVFDIRFDNLNDRIVFIWRDEFGGIIGTTGRYNYVIPEDKKGKIPKYLVLDKFAKANHLFGLNVTLSDIMMRNLVIVVESEKSVMKLWQMGYPFAVAVGNHNITPQQALILKKYCKRVIIAFDDGLDEDEVINVCNSIADDFDNVSYIFDDENKYLPKDSKMSPADLTINDFKNCMQHCMKKIK